ncbi:MAG: nucleoside triphosphate pyrophosphohydrolase [Clostridia bacterium]|nr:nucleoside triphosphate pyrophosphohydrolase [Clostridia bacterium]
MSTIHHNKLVRDRIPEIIVGSGKTCATRILPQEEYLAALDAKLTEELADLLEVMMAVAEARGHSFAEVEAIRRAKAEKRGGFRERIFLESVTD